MYKRQDYEFEKEYAYGDFNAHSKADAERQDGIDTFEDKDIVFQDISYDQLKMCIRDSLYPDQKF